MAHVQRITPCLWFDHEAEEAVAFYTSIFKNSKLVNVVRYGEAGREIHGGAAGSVMTVTFQLDGQEFVALNGGPVFTFNEAISLQIQCDTQEEVDYYWERLADGGDEKAQQCGWLKDRFGVSWQVTPTILAEMLKDPDAARAARATEAMLRMKKLDIGELRKAFEGVG